MQTQTEISTPDIDPDAAISQQEKIRFKHHLRATGTTMREFAETQAIDYMSLCRIIRGYNKGHFGMGFHAKKAVRDYLVQLES
ncbi:MAG: hypothetical protein KDI44_14315 [Thiothrix sp.]|nr:hypothetical protein [Thiothrix sp.]HPQ96252.1 hypothetical protein [Thiolinea sp.]